MNALSDLTSGLASSPPDCSMCACFAMLMVITMGGVMYSRQRQRTAWSGVAKQLGVTLEWDGGKPSMKGIHRGVAVEIDTVTRGTGKNRRVYTRVRVPMPGSPPEGLAVLKEGFMSSFGKLIGMQDIEIGNSIVDEALIIRGPETEAARTYMRQPHVSTALLRFIRSKNENSVAEGSLQSIRSGVANQPQHIIELLDDVTRAHSALRPDEVPGLPEIPKRVAVPKSMDKASTEDVKLREPESTQAASLQTQAPGPESADPEPTEPAPALTSPSAPVESPTSLYSEQAPQPDLPVDLQISPAITEQVPAIPAELREPVVQDTSVHVDVQAVLSQIATLTDRGTSLSKQKQLEDAITGKRIRLSLTVQRVRSTLDLSAPEHLKGGLTINGEHGELSFAARFPTHRTDEVQGLKSGDTVSIDGTLSGWERLYRQAIIDVE